MARPVERGRGRIVDVDVAAGRDVVFVPGLLVGSAPGEHFVSFEVVA